MLANVGSRDQDLGERYRIVRKEVKLQEVLGVRVFVDDVCDVNDEANSLRKVL